MDVLQPDEALQQQARADQQHERERHFGDDERVAKPIAADAAGRTAAAFLQRFGQFRLAARERGDEADDNSGHDRGAERHEQDAQIEIHFGEARHGLRADRSQQIESPDREHHAGGPADQREQDAFRKHLPHELRAAGAEGETNGELAFPRSGAREQHGGEIRAGDQQARPPPRRAESSGPAAFRR